MRIFQTGQKRPVTSETDEGPNKKNQKLEYPSFACNGGEGKKQKTKDYIEKCKRREVTPVVVSWDKNKYLEKEL